MKKDTNKDIKLSVIIPVYKVEKYLDRCLESVVNQTYKNLEILLIDDGSPDKCPEICDEWTKKDNRIIVIHKENSGVSSTRNLGIEKATGNFLTFVDSDDTIDPTMYEKMISSIKENIDMVFCRFKHIHLDGKIDYENEINLSKLEEDKNAVLSFYYRPTKNKKNQNTMGACWRVIFRRSFIEQNNLYFNTNIKIQEDKEFILRSLGYCNKVKVLNEHFYNYYKTPNSALNNNKNYKNLLTSYQSLYENEIETLRKNKNITEKMLKLIKRKASIDYLTTIFYRHILGDAPKTEIKQLYKNEFIKRLLKDGKLVFNRKFISFKKLTCFMLIKLKMLPILKILLKLFRY